MEGSDLSAYGSNSFRRTWASLAAQQPDVVSDDLIEWSAPRKIELDIQPNVSKMVVAMNYPTFMDPSAPEAYGDNNFYTIGRRPYLYWASIGHSPHTDGRPDRCITVSVDIDQEQTLR